MHFDRLRGKRFQQETRNFECLCHYFLSAILLYWQLWFLARILQYFDVRPSSPSASEEKQEGQTAEHPRTNRHFNLFLLLLPGTLGGGDHKHRLPQQRCQIHREDWGRTIWRGRFSEALFSKKFEDLQFSFYLQVYLCEALGFDSNANSKATIMMKFLKPYMSEKIR